MPVAVPSDRRFRRAHIKPARRRRAWHGRVLRALRHTLVLVVIGYGGYTAVDFLLQTRLLQVSQVVVRGNHRLSTGEVLAALDGLRGENIATVDLDMWRQKLLKSPWVARAEFRRVLPSTILIELSERAPIGIGRLGRELYLVDASGTIIDQYGPHYAEFDLPIIDGLDSPPSQGASLIDEDRAALVARLIQAVSSRRDLARRISQIDVSNRRDVVVVLDGESALIRLGDERFLERLQSYIDLAPTLHERIPDIEYVDLRFDERVYVRPLGRSRPALSRAGLSKPVRRRGRG